MCNFFAYFAATVGSDRYKVHKRKATDTLVSLGKINSPPQ